MVWLQRDLFFGSLLTICIMFYGVSSQQYPPIPGDSSWVANLTYIVNSTIRYAYMRQSPINMEWTSLTTSLTVEFWLKPSAFPSDPDGKWNPVYTLRGEPQFLPVISRHPGMGNVDQWAHFWVQLVRTVYGLALNVYAGCGCAVPPQIVNGTQVDLYSCGYGYLLSSNSPSITAAGGTPFYVPTESWTHIAFTFDGDSTEPTKTQQAALYINGNLLVTNKWGSPSNIGSIYNKTTCLDKPMQWFSNLGLMSDIRLGYLKNQDFNYGRVVDDPNTDFNFYGFNGTFDEFRVWRTVRTPSEIQNWYNTALDAKQIAADCLVAYYKFNEGPVGNISAGQINFPNLKQGGPNGTVVSTSPNTTSLNFWANSRGDKQLGLVINTKVTAIGILPATPIPPPTLPIQTVFQFPGTSHEPIPPNPFPILSTNFQPFNLSIWKVSPALGQALINGDLTLTIQNTGAPLIPASDYRTSNLPPYNTLIVPTTILQPNQSIIAVVNCSDTKCSNLLAYANSTTPLAYFPYQSFAIYYQTVPPSSLLATTYLNVVPHCDGLYDACGVCNGDNRTCTCVVYSHGSFKSVRMSYILLQFMVDFLLEKVSATSQLLDETIDKVEGTIQQGGTIPTAALQTEFLMGFYNGPLSTYCNIITNFLNALTL